MTLAAYMYTKWHVGDKTMQEHSHCYSTECLHGYNSLVKNNHMHVCMFVCSQTHVATTENKPPFYS